ncbi:hypothetical protein CEXT_141921 [Caerostris extrusa]|uniref:Uncharacterized protein n=1 Tax=Caerostris extrusa TaxID=172846 RepID=A0AAV4QRA7_CAEEX|nr:hypothetical protein CEXT_141921 [Caerostris extrusa]
MPKRGGGQHKSSAFINFSGMTSLFLTDEPTTPFSSAARRTTASTVSPASPSPRVVTQEASVVKRRRSFRHRRRSFGSALIEE